MNKNLRKGFIVIAGIALIIDNLLLRHKLGMEEKHNENLQGYLDESFKQFDDAIDLVSEQRETILICTDKISKMTEILKEINES